MSPMPPPGWYPDPSSSRIFRWWDGQAWTRHTSVGEPAAATAPVLIAPPVPPAPSTPPAPPAPADCAAPFAAPVAQATSVTPAAVATELPQAPVRAGGGSLWERNRYALITMGIVAVYVILAVETHIVMLGIWPILMSIRSWQRKEPIAGLAVCAAVAAMLIAVLALTGG